MTELQIINQQEVLGKQFKVYGTVQEPLFLAKDVAEWIEHSNPRMMLKSIDEDEKVVNNAYTLGGNQECLFLTENGLYEVLMQSRKPIAKQFKKEVKKILKQIRFTGGYVAENREEEFIEKYFPSFSNDVKLAMVKDLYQQNQTYKDQVDLLEPQAEAYIDLMTAQGYYKLIDVAAVLDKGRNKLFAFLRSTKVLTKQSNFNVPYGRFRKNGCFKVICSKNEKGHFSTITMVSPKGLDYIYKLIHKYHAEEKFNLDNISQLTKEVA